LEDSDKFTENITLHLRWSYRTRGWYQYRVNAGLILRWRKCVRER